MRHGTFFETDDGRQGVRFERRLAHPVERVWQAVTDPEQLASWFPARVEIDGERMRFHFPDDQSYDSTGAVVELDPPRVFAFTWEDDELRFELSPDGDGCVLVLTNVLGGEHAASSVAAGWHVCLDELEKLLAGEPASAPGTKPTQRHTELEAEYQARLDA